MVDFRSDKNFPLLSADGYDIYVDRADGVDILKAKDINDLADSVVEVQSRLNDAYQITDMLPQAVTLTNGQTMVYNAATGKMEAGDAGGGGGEINYLQEADVNFDGESTILTSWTLTAGALVERTTTVGEKLRGDGSLRLRDTGAAGTIKATFDIPEADENKLLKIQFDLKALGAYSSGDFTVEIDEVSGSVIDIPASQGLFTHTFVSVAAGTYTLTFTNASGGAISAANGLALDNVIVGPGSIVTGAIVGEWESFTPSWSGGVVFTGDLYKRRVGTNMEIIGSAVWSSNPTGDIVLDVPDGLNIDSSLYSTNPTLDGRIVFGLAVADSGSRTGRFTYGSATTLEIQGVHDATGKWSDTVPATWVATNKIGIQLSVPVAEWAGSGTVNLITDDVTQANMRLKYTNITTFATSVSAYDIVKFGTSVYDVGADYNSTTGAFTAPADGEYRFSVRLGVTAQMATGDALYLVLKLNDLTSSSFNHVIQHPQYHDRWNATEETISLSKGDTISVHVLTTGNNYTLENSTARSTFSVERVADYTAGQPVGFGLATADNAGLVKKNRWQRKLLTATTTVDATVVTALTFSNLTVGKHYRISHSVWSDGAGAGYATLGYKQSGTVVSDTAAYPDTGNNTHQASTSTVFLCDDTTLLAFVSKSTVTGYLGASTRPFTHAILEELNDYVDETTDWA